jgi:hypothetical protein
MNAVYIPTKNRYHLLERTLPRWLDYNLDPIVVMEKQYVDDINRLNREFPTVNILVLPKNDNGIGYARRSIVMHAAREGYRAIIMSSDDIRPSGDMEGMVKFAERRDVLGVGAWMSIYGLYMPNTRLKAAAKRKRKKAYLHSGSVGYQCFALNIVNAKQAGNYDHRMSYGEDSELAREAMAAFGLPWMIWAGSLATPIENSTVTLHRSKAKKKGGLYGLGNRSDMAHFSHSISAKRWPDYCKVPPYGELRIRFRWKDFFRDTIEVKTWPPENIPAGDKPYAWRGK